MVYGLAAAAALMQTYRLVGTLDGHLATYRHQQLPAAVRAAQHAADPPGGASILAQPARLPAPTRPAGMSWWHHDGALAVVFTGLPAGDLVLPVRLPSGAGQWPHVAHFLADPGIWHKIDLVRVRDRKAPGGWRYYAHLLIHGGGYQSPSTIARREQIPAGRRAGVDANVSNLALASFATAQPERPLVERIDCSDAQRKTAARVAQQTRSRQRALDRSRRNTNAAQYGPSVRQHKRAQRRTAKGLPARQIANPGGARHARTDGVPLRAYRHDELSQRYQRTRCDHGAQARRISQAKQARVTALAAAIVATHGNTMTPAPRGSTTDLPTPCAMGWPPSKSGRVQSTGTSHHHHPMTHRPGPAATTRWPLLNKQHPAHPRTDQPKNLDVAGPAENNQPPR